MSRDNSHYIVGDYWLDKRRDGKAPDIWQIAHAVKRSIVYRSTHCRGLEEAKGALEAHVAAQRALTRQEAREAQVLPLLMTYWREHGKKVINYDQTGRSLRTFIGFLMHDVTGVAAVVTDLTPALFERFRQWRMESHGFKLHWSGELVEYASKGVGGATVQRNINDIRAAVHHAEANLRIPAAPKIRDLSDRYRSPTRDRILTEDELARIVWYSYHSPEMFRFVALQMVTSVRPMAGLRFDPCTQYDDRRGLIDLQPFEAPQTKKRNAIIPAIRPMRVVLRAWCKEGTRAVSSRKTAWRNMRRVLGLSEDVHPKTIRYTIATWLYEMEWVPERQISEMLGHSNDGPRGLARTSKVYAKYRPENMGLVMKALTIIWMRTSRQARAFAADHLLTTGQRGDPFLVKFKKKTT